MSRLADATSGRNAALPRLGAEQLDKLQSYLQVLLLWRTRVALISTADPVALVEHHIIDCLHVAAHVPERARVGDIGSGAGLPGIPLAVACSEARVCLIESRRKKANFLRDARRQTGLPNIEVMEGRAEDIQPPASFDVIVSRALGPVDEFLGLGRQLLGDGGLAVAMRGPDGDQEAQDFDGFEAPRVVRYELAEGRRRTLLLYRRT